MKTCRVFISSTFRDMAIERTALVTEVFPALNARLAPFAFAVPIDLRWGVPAGASYLALRICLDEIERCRPLLLVILGDRYGWQPDTYKVPAESRYDWVRDLPQGLSITHLEILHGLLNDPPAVGPIAYFRLPSNAGPEDPQSKLKEAVRAAAPINRTYTTIAEFERQVGADLECSIRSYLGSALEVDASEDPRVGVHRDQRAFAESRARVVFGRDGVLEELRDRIVSVQSGTTVILGPPGSGKSSIMARLALSLEETVATATAFHFVGSTPNSTIPERVLEHLAHQVAAGGNPNRPLAAMLKGQERGVRPPVLLVDAINQLVPSTSVRNPSSLAWLVAALTGPVHCVCSVVDTAPAAAAALARPDAVAVHIKPLEVEDSRAAIEAHLALFRKVLDEEQMEMLLSKDSARSPLYIAVACAELRLHGRFETLSDAILDLPGAVPELFDAVLERLEAQHGGALVSAAAGFISMSRSGLLEEELLGILDVPRAEWLPVFYSLREYMIPPGPAGVMMWFHEQIHFAVLRRYCNSAESVTAAHAAMARFFGRRGGLADARAMDAVIHHSVRGGADGIERARRLLADAHFLKARVAARQVRAVLGDFADYVDTVDTGDLGDAKISAWHRFLSSTAFALESDPDLFLQEALHQPHGGPVHTAAVAERLGSSLPLVMWKSRPLDLCRRTVSAHSHWGMAMATNTAAESSWVATVGRDRALRLWDIRTGALVAALSDVHESAIMCVAQSADGRTLVDGSKDRHAAVYRFVDGDETAGGVLQVQHILQHQGTVLGCDMTADGARCVTAAADQAARLWNAATGELVALMAHDEPLACCRFGADGSRVVTAGSQVGRIAVWDTESGERLAVMSDDVRRAQTALAVQWPIAVVGGDREIVHVWNLETEELAAQLISHRYTVMSVGIGLSGRIYSGGWDHMVRLWDGDWLASPGTVTEPTATIFSHGMAVTGVGECRGSLVTLCHDGCLRYFDADPLVSIREDGQTPPPHTHFVNSVGLDMRRGVVWTTSHDRSARLQRLDAPPDESRRFGPHRKYCVSLGLLDDGRIVTGTLGAVLVWGADEGVAPEERSIGHRERYCYILPGPGEDLVWQDNGAIYALADGQARNDLVGQESDAEVVIKHATRAADGTVAALLEDGTVWIGARLIGKVKGGRTIAVGHGVVAVAASLVVVAIWLDGGVPTSVSRKGKTRESNVVSTDVAVCDDDTVVASYRDGKVMVLRKGADEPEWADVHSAPINAVTDVGSGHFATASLDHSVRVFAVDAPAGIRRVWSAVMGGQAVSVAGSVADRLLVAGDRNGTVMVADLC